MEKNYRVVVESTATTLVSISDPLDGAEAIICPAGQTTAFEVTGEDKFNRLTPILVELDARDDYEVTVEEL